MNAWNLVGHDWAVRRLQQSIASDQLAQSHLFAGPEGVGKAALARAFARAILALGASDATRSAALVERLKHPDLTWIEPEASETSIKVEQVRGLLHTLTLAPVEGRFRVAVVNEAHLATDGGQNAILKTLEEPNPSSVIVLVAPQTDNLLPTIVSRCQALNLRTVPADEIEQAILARGAEPAKAHLLAHLSRGRPGWALRALEDEEILANRAQRLADLHAVLGARRTDRFAYAEKLGKAAPEGVRAVLEEWLWFWRDVARAAGAPAGQIPTEALLNIDQADAITGLASRLSPAEASSVLRAIGSTLSALGQNANPRLALDALLLQLPAA